MLYKEVPFPYINVIPYSSIYIPIIIGINKENNNIIANLILESICIKLLFKVKSPLYLNSIQVERILNINIKIRTKQK